MHLKQYLEDNGISIYKLASSASVAYPTVYNIVNEKVDILNCALGVVKKIANALGLTLEEMLTLCDRNYTFALFRGEQCNLVRRLGEIDYIVDLVKKRKIDYYWKLDMKMEAFYLLAMLDYLSNRNNLPRCTDYEEIRKNRLLDPVYPADTELTEKLLDKDIRQKMLAKAIPEFLAFNIVESEVIDE